MLNKLIPSYAEAKNQLETFLKKEIHDLHHMDVHLLSHSHDKREVLFQNHFDALHEILSYCQKNTTTSLERRKQIK